MRRELSDLGLALGIANRVSTCEEAAKFSTAVNQVRGLYLSSGLALTLVFVDKKAAKEPAYKRVRQALRQFVGHTGNGGFAADVAALDTAAYIRWTRRTRQGLILLARAAETREIALGCAEKEKKAADAAPEEGAP
ncbi:MAG: hypothetical protein KIS66_02635 [Fimbriimonadaceae bacterium]|nr:hypothetical protein [Fimbriimonadaceae bacterium]